MTIEYHGFEKLLFEVTLLIVAFQQIIKYCIKLLRAAPGGAAFCWQAAWGGSSASPRGPGSPASPGGPGFF